MKELLCLESILLVLTICFHSTLPKKISFMSSCGVYFLFVKNSIGVPFVLWLYGSINSSTDKFGKISSIVISTFGSM